MRAGCAPSITPSSSPAGISSPRPSASASPLSRGRPRSPRVPTRSCPCPLPARANVKAGAVRPCLFFSPTGGAPPRPRPSPRGPAAPGPSPSPRRRKRERGYDPAMLLADETGRLLATPRRALLSRTRETPPQSTLPAAQRRGNVEGAFASSPRARGRVLVLVDDVVTTGATLFAAARALREAGARDVRALVLARTPEPT